MNEPGQNSASNPSDKRVDANQLSGVSETALATLNSRAYQAGLPDPLIHDPVAAKLVDAIDFDFGKFGRSQQGQEFALRALAFDGCVHRYLQKHPNATVVALAEGLQTSFWRLSHALPDAQFKWISVDFPPIVELRERLLPSSPRVANLAQSALDYSWMDGIDAGQGVVVTAEGLLMYLQPAEAMDLIAQCAKRFPGGQMVFDLPPTIIKLMPKGAKMGKNYRWPPMPFTASSKQLANLVDTVPGVRAVHDVPMPKGRGLLFGAVVPTLWRFGPLKPFRGAYTVLEFD